MQYIELDRFGHRTKSQHILQIINCWTPIIFILFDLFCFINSITCFYPPTNRKFPKIKIPLTAYNSFHSTDRWKMICDQQIIMLIFIAQPSNTIPFAAILIHLCVLFAICSLSTRMEARCSGGSIAICSSDSCSTCMISCAFSWSDASFGMPVGIRFGSADCCGGTGGGGCCGLTRGSTRWRGSVWNGATNERGGFDGGTVSETNVERNKINHQWWTWVSHKFESMCVCVICIIDICYHQLIATFD